MQFSMALQFYIRFVKIKKELCHILGVTLKAQVQDSIVKSF